MAMSTGGSGTGVGCRPGAGRTVTSFMLCNVRASEGSQRHGWPRLRAGRRGGLGGSSGRQMWLCLAVSSNIRAMPGGFRIEPRARRLGLQVKMALRWASMLLGKVGGQAMWLLNDGPWRATDPSIISGPRASGLGIWLKLVNRRATALRSGAISKPLGWCVCGRAWSQVALGQFFGPRLS